MDRRQEIDRSVIALRNISAADSTRAIFQTAHEAATLLATVGRELEAAQSDLARYKEAVRTAANSAGYRIGTNTGHGHVWPRPDGVKARCGGPAMCTECARDREDAIAKAAAPSLPATPIEPTVHMVAAFLRDRCCCTAEGKGDGTTCSFCVAHAVVQGLNSERHGLRIQLETLTMLSQARERQYQAAVAARDKTMLLLESAHRQMTPTIQPTGQSLWQQIREHLTDGGTSGP